MARVFIVHHSLAVRRALCTLVTKEGHQMVGVSRSNNGALQRIENLDDGARPEIVVITCPIEDARVVSGITEYCRGVKFLAPPVVIINDLETTIDGEKFLVSLRAMV